MNEALIVIGALSQISRAFLDIELRDHPQETIILFDHPNRETELQLLKQELSQNMNINCIAATLDVRSRVSIKEAFSQSGIKNLYPNRVLYAAGVNDIKSPFQFSEEDYDRIMDTNLRGFFFTARHVASCMMSRSGGSIVAIASQHSVRPGHDRVVYNASKAGLMMMVKSFALEWAGYGIRLNTVSPTLIASADNTELIGHRGFAESYLKHIPLHSFASPENVAEAIAFLLSSKSEMITGENLLIDGGWCIGP